MMKKRICSLFLALCLLTAAVPLVSVGTSAADEPAETPAFDYDDLYVQDGLTILLSAWDTSEAGTEGNPIQLNKDGTGTWASVKGSDKGFTATLHGTENVAEWGKAKIEIEEGKSISAGIGYDLSIGAFASDDGTLQCRHRQFAYLDLGINHLPEGDYSVEYVANIIGILQDGEKRQRYVCEVKDNAWAYGFGLEGSGFVFGPFKTGRCGPALNTEKNGSEIKQTAESTFDLRWAYGASDELTWNDNAVMLGADSTFNTVAVWGQDAEKALTNFGGVAKETVTYQERDVQVSNTVNDVTTYSVGKEGTYQLYDGYSNKTPTVYNIPFQGNYKQPNGVEVSCNHLGKQDTFSFRLFDCYPANIYSVRVYNKTLSLPEILVNNFADLAAYYRLDMTEFASFYTDSQGNEDVYKKNIAKAICSEAFNGVTFATHNTYEDYQNGKEAAQVLLNARVDYLNTKSYSSVYSSLYVTDGLKVLLDAYDGNNASVDLEHQYKGDVVYYNTNGAYDVGSIANRANYWVNLVNGSYAYLVRDNVNNIGWSARQEISNGSYSSAAGGIWYNSTFDDRSNGVSLCLPITFLPSGDFTIETAAIGVGYTKNENTETADGYTRDASGNDDGAHRYANDTNNAMAIGALKADGFPSPSTAKFDIKNNELRWNYVAKKNNWNGPTADDSGIYGGFKASDAMFAVNDLKAAATVVNWRIEREWKAKELSGSAQGKTIVDTYTFHNDANGQSWTSSSQNNKFVSTNYTDFHNDAGGMLFDLFKSFPATVYCVRVYDKILSSDEVARNRFADLAAFYKLDVTLFKALSADRQLYLCQLLSSNILSYVDYGKTKEYLQNAIGVSESVSNEKTKYDELYAETNLVGLYTAFGNNLSYDLENGLWLNKVQGSPDATLHGGAYDASSNPLGWKKGADGGLNYSDSGFSAANVYLSLDDSYMQGNTSLTVEVVMAISFRNIPFETETLRYTTGAGTQIVKMAGSGENNRFRFSRATNWLYTARQCGDLTLTLYSETPGKKTVRIYYSTSASSWESLYTGDSVTYKDTEVTFEGMDQTGSGKYVKNVTVEGIPGANIVAEMPNDVELYKAVSRMASDTNSSCVWDGFKFGPLYMTVWSNLQGCNTYTNGFGLSRIYYSSVDWSKKNVGVGFKDTYNLKDYFNGTIGTLTMKKSVGDSASTFVLYGNQKQFYDNSSSAVNISMAVQETNYITNNNSFHLMKNLPGTVYAVRIYQKSLEAANERLNHFVDLCAYYQVDVSGLKQVSQDALAALAAKYAACVLGKMTDAEVREMTANISGFIPQETLYVTKGLRVLYTALGEQKTHSVYRDGNNLCWLGFVNSVEDAENNGPLVRGGSTATFVQDDKATGDKCWKVGDRGGVGYADANPGSGTANMMNNYLSLDTKYVNQDCYFVEVVKRADFRDTTSVVNNYTESSITGGKRYVFEADWAPTRACSVCKISLTGTAGDKVNVTKSNGNVSENEEKELTFDEDGKAVWWTSPSAKNIYTIDITGSYTSVSFGTSHSNYEWNSYDGFVVGNMWGVVWTNLSGCNGWGNGFGTTRWYYGAKSWGDHAGSANNGTFYYNFGDNTKKEANMVANNGKVATMQFYKNRSDNTFTFLVKDGANTLVDKKDAPNDFQLGTAPNLVNKHFETGDTPESKYAGSQFTLMHRLPGTVYAVRVYNRRLGEDEQKQNYVADLLAFYNIDDATVDVVLDAFENKNAGWSSFVTACQAIPMDDTGTEYQKNQKQVVEKINGILQPTQQVDAIKELTKGLLTYKGLAARLSKGGGIRSQYIVNQALVHSLEAMGYKVAYGAIMGQYDSSKGYTALNITGGGWKDKTVGTGVAIRTVYYTGATKGEDLLKYNEGDPAEDGELMFTLALDLSKTSTTNAQYLTATQGELLFRGFYVIAPSDATNSTEGTVYYVNGEGQTGDVFAHSGSLYGVSTSVKDVSHYFSQTYQDTPGHLPFAGNYWLNFILKGAK